MSKALERVTRELRNDLLQAGATSEQIASFELAVLRTVLAQAELSGSPLEYPLTRITTLEGFHA